MRAIILFIMFIPFKSLGLSLKEIEEDIFGSKKLNKAQVMNKLNNISNNDKNLNFYLLGIVHGYGFYGNEANLDKAEEYFLSLAKMDYKHSNYFLGSLLSNSSDNERAKRAASFLVSASKNGDLDALYNLYN